MTAVNHAVTGAIIVITAPNPILGLGLAYLSHFALDALPHFGADTVAKTGSREHTAILLFDTFMTTMFILIATFAGYRAGLPVWLIPAGSFLAWIPDLLWYKQYKKIANGVQKGWDTSSLHKRIQRYERSWGWMVEVAWFVASVALLSWLIFN